MITHNQGVIHIDEFEAMRTSIGADEMYIEELFRIYHHRLLANHDVCNLLYRRGVSHPVIAANTIGYCDRKLNRYVAPSEKQQGAAFRGALRRAGLTKENGHEVFRGCVVEPFREGNAIVAACGIKVICPSRPAPRIIQWFNKSVYTAPVSFHIMAWGKRYVTEQT